MESRLFLLILTIGAISGVAETITQYKILVNEEKLDSIISQCVMPVKYLSRIPNHDY